MENTVIFLYYVQMFVIGVFMGFGFGSVVFWLSGRQK